jgi:hypothetical protein
MYNIQQGLIAILLLACIPTHSSADDHFLCREVGEDWVWFEDHLATYVTYVTRGPRDRTYEVGTGISVNGSPWGKRKKYTLDAEFNAYGMGALHIRKGDSGSNFVVCATGSDIGTLPIIPARDF